MSEKEVATDYVGFSGMFLPDDGTDPLFDDAITRPPRAKVSRLPRSERAFGKVNLRSLQDRRFNALYTPAGRLYHRLEIETRRGARPVRLTYRLAAEVGILRQNKARYLRELQRLGLVSIVTREGKQVPLVALHPPSE